MTQEKNDAPAPTDRGTTRMTIDLTPEFSERLQALVAKTYLGNKATVVRHSLTIMEYLIKVLEEEGEIRIRTRDGKETLLNRVALAIAS